MLSEPSACSGTEVVERPDEHAGLGETGAGADMMHGARDTEVGEQGPLLVPEDVLGLEVAVHHTVRMGVGERLGQVGDDVLHLGDVHRPGIGEAPAKGATLDERHDEVEAAGGFATGEQRDDVGMNQPGGEPDLLGEPVGPERLQIRCRGGA